MFCARRWSGPWFVTWLLFPAVVGGDDGMQSVSFREIKDDAVKVKAIRFQHVSDKPFKNSKLRAAMKTFEGKKFLRRFFRSDLNKLKNLYRGQGYMDVDIVRRSFQLDGEERLHIHLKIDSGPQWKVADVALEIAGAALDTTALRKIAKVETGTAFLYGEVLADERDLLAYLNNKGFAHARVQNQLELDSGRRTAKVVYEIDPGRRMYFGEVRVIDRRSLSTEGLRTRPQLVRLHLTFGKGQLFDPEELRRSRNNLARTDLFSSVMLGLPAPAVGADSLQPVEVLLQEKKYIHLEANAFLNNTEPGLSANVQHANWLGRGMRLGMDASLGRPLQGSTVYITERNILRSGADLTLSAGVTDEWGRTEVTADPTDAGQFDLLTTNDSVLGDLLLAFGEDAANEYIRASVLSYRSIERLWQFNGTVAKSWETDRATYGTHFALTWVDSRTRPAEIGGSIGYGPGQDGVDAGSDDGGFDDGGFDDGGFDDPGFDEGVDDSDFDDAVDDADYLNGKIPIDEKWQLRLTDKARALNFSVAFQGDTRDNQIKPSRGSFLRLAGLYAVQVGGQAARVVDGDLEGRYYLPVGGHLVWAQAVHLVATASLREDRALPQPYWKEFGGEGSVRGVKRDGIQALGGGRAGLNVRSELRTSVRQYGLVLFWDRAGVWRRSSEVSLADMVDGYGVGVRYDLGIPFRLDVGWSNGFEERSVYFSIGQAF